MILSKEEICRWANASDSKSNFKEGERIINADHIIYCGKNIDFNGSVRLSSKCLSISSLKRELHEIKWEEGTLPWAISFFFFNEKKINIFRLVHIALFLKVTY